MVTFSQHGFSKKKKIILSKVIRWYTYKDFISKSFWQETVWKRNKELSQIKTVGQKLEVKIKMK